MSHSCAALCCLSFVQATRIKEIEVAMALKRLHEEADVARARAQAAHAKVMRGCMHARVVRDLAADCDCECGPHGDVGLAEIRW